MRVEAETRIGSRRLTVRTLLFVLVANGRLPFGESESCSLAMNEEEIENHFDEIYYKLQACKKRQLDSFKEDLK